MKTAVVSGANGFVGSAVVRELIKHDIKVFALVRPGSNNNLPNHPLVEFVGLDIQEIEKLEKKYISADIFYHFAWVGSAGPARANTSLQLQNAQWTIDCMKIAKEIGCKRFVPAGSIMEYETVASAYTRGNKPGLGYIYGAGKLAAHTMAMSVAADIGIELIPAKITNAYGPGELSPRFVNTTIRKIIKGEPLEFTAGTQNYDFVYIDDVATAFYLIGKNGKSFCEYTIGSSTARPLKEFILELQHSIAPDKEFIFGDIPFTGTNLPLSQFSCAYTEEETGFKAKVTFAQGVKKTMEWLKEVED